MSDTRTSPLTTPSVNYPIGETMPTLSLEELSAALSRGAKHDLGAEGAVDLLIKHKSWLRRPELQDEKYLIIEGDKAYLRYRDILKSITDGEIYSSSSEEVIMQIAGSLARSTPVSLHDLYKLDQTNRRLALAAIAQALEVDVAISAAPDDRFPPSDRPRY